MNRAQAEKLQERIEARWPEATDVDVMADDEGALIQMRVYGESYKFSVVEGGALLLLLLNGAGAFSR